MPGWNFPVQPVHTGRNCNLCLLHSLTIAWTSAVFSGKDNRRELRRVIGRHDDRVITDILRPDHIFESRINVSCLEP